MPRKLVENLELGRANSSPVQNYCLELGLCVTGFFGVQRNPLSKSTTRHLSIPHNTHLTPPFSPPNSSVKNLPAASVHCCPLLLPQMPTGHSVWALWSIGLLLSHSMVTSAAQHNNDFEDQLVQEAVDLSAVSSNEGQMDTAEMESLLHWAIGEEPM